MDKGTIRDINKLIIRIGKGDKLALELLFEMTSRQLYTVAMVYLMDKSKVDDVISDAFVRVAKYSSSFDKAKNGYNWLYGIVKNLCYSANKYDMEHRTCDIDKVVLRGENDSNINIDNIVLHTAIDRLEREEKRIIWYYYFAGYSIKEVGEIIGKPKSTTADMLGRIIEKLRGLMGE